MSAPRFGQELPQRRVRGARETVTRISESTWIRRTPSGLRWDVYLRGDLVATFLDESAATWFAENYPDDAEAVQS